MIVIIQNLDEWKNLLQSNAFVVQGECLITKTILFVYLSLILLDPIRKKLISNKAFGIWNSGLKEQKFICLVGLSRAKNWNILIFNVHFFLNLLWKWRYFSSRLWMFVSNLVLFSISNHGYHFHPISILLYWNCHIVCW